MAYFLRQDVQDAAGNIALAQSPVILAAAMSPPPTGLGPILGAVAGIAAIAGIQALIAVTKGAIGADAGVVGIDGNYNTAPSRRDTIPIWVRHGESIITPEGTSQNKDLLQFINKTNRPAIDFFKNDLSSSSVSSSGVLTLANSNQVRTAQIFQTPSHSGEFGAMQNSLANIERSLSSAKILQTHSRHTSDVNVKIDTQKGFIAKEQKNALRLARARG